MQAPLKPKHGADARDQHSRMAGKEVHIEGMGTRRLQSCQMIEQRASVV